MSFRLVITESEEHSPRPILDFGAVTISGASVEGPEPPVVERTRIIDHHGYGVLPEGLPGLTGAP